MRTFLLEAAHCAVVQFLLADAKAGAEVLTAQGFTALHIAAQCGHLAVVKYHVTQANADVASSRWARRAHSQPARHESV